MSMKNRKIDIVKIIYYFSVIFTFCLVGANYLLRNQGIYADELFATSSLDDFVSVFYPWAITVSSALAVVMLIYSGYLFVTSAGNMEQVNKAKEYIVGALSGLAFLILAALIFRTLQL